MQPKRWLLDATRSNWNYLRDLGQWAISDRAKRSAQRITPGDMGIV